MKVLRIGLGLLFLMIGIYAIFFHKQTLPFKKFTEKAENNRSVSSDIKTKNGSIENSFVENAYLSAALPRPQGPGELQWKLDQQDQNFLTYQPYADQVWVYPYEIRYELINNKWQHIEGALPPEPHNSLQFPHSTDYESLLEEPEALVISTKLYQKQWWVGPDNSYLPVYQIEITYEEKRREFLFINASTGEILKRTTRARH